MLRLKRSNGDTYTAVAKFDFILGVTLHPVSKNGESVSIEAISNTILTSLPNCSSRLKSN